MKEELDENGYKKSKLSLEDLSDPKYSQYIEARQENARSLKYYWELPENKERLRAYTSKLGLKSKEDGYVAKNMAKGRHTMWVENYEKYANILREHIANWGPEIYEKLSAGGKIGGRTRGDQIIEFGQHENAIKALEESRDPQKAADARQIIQCTHCGKEGLTGNINRWHNDNCKIMKLKESASKHLPNTDFRFFDIPEIIELIAKESGFTGGQRGSTIDKLKAYNFVEKTKTKGKYKKINN